MTHAEQALLAPDTAAGLTAAQAAVAALQRAFGRSRYILRTIPARSRVDPSRRLSGELSAAGNWRRDLESPTTDRQTRESRALLSDLLDIAARVQARRPVSPQTFTLLAERALAIDSSDDVWQESRDG